MRAINKTHDALKNNIELATEVGQKLFPEAEAKLIADVIKRDLPYYSTAISEDFVRGMNAFQKAVGIVKNDVSYEQAVSLDFSKYWK